MLRRKAKHRQSTARRTTLRSVLAGALAVLLVGGLVSVPAATALGGAKYGYGVKGGTGAGYWMGSFILDNGEIVYCAMQNDVNIDPAGTLNYGSVKPTFGAKTRVSSWTGNSLGGGSVAMSGTKVNRLAYVLSKWGDTTNKTRALAVKRLLLQKSGVGMSAGQTSTSGAAAVVDLVDEMWAESAKYYGPYKINPILTTRTDQKYIDVTNIGVKSSAGNWTPGYKMTLKITGGATWAANDTKTLTVTTGTSTLERRIDVARASEVTVTATVSGLPDHLLTVRKAKESRISGYPVQDVVVAGETVGLDAERTVTPTATPKIVTTTSAATTTPGAWITDKLVVSAGTGMWPTATTIKVNSTLYGPFATKPGQTSAVPAGAPVVGTVSTNVTGPGTYTTPSIQLPAKKGYYVWRETSAASSNGLVKAWNGAFGVPSEITYADWNNFGYKITTQTSSATASRGAALTDLLTASTTSGTWVPGHSFNVTSTLYGPFATAPTQTASVPAGAPKVGSVTTTITGPGAKRTPAITLPQKSGYYVWHETAPATAYTAAWSAPFGVASERTLVPFNPTVTTVAQPEVIDDSDLPVKATLRDQITVTGAAPGATVTATARLYYAGATRPTTVNTVPASAVLVGQVDVSIPIQSSGTGIATTPGVTLTSWDEGYYTWVVSVAAGSGGVSTAYTSDYGIPAETRWLEEFGLAPYVITVASKEVARAGDVLSDTLVVDDASHVVSADQPLTVTSTLWGPVDAYEVGVNVPAGTPKVGEVQTVVGSGGTYVTDGVQLPSNAPEGFYVWTYSFPANGGLTDADLPPGTLMEYDGREDLTVYAEETTVVPWEPKVATETSHKVAEAGTAITDALHVTDGRPGYELEVVSTLYGPFDRRPVEGAAIPADAPKVGTVFTSVTPGADGSARATTDPLTVPESGYYVWHETIAESPDRASAPWDGVFGLVDETTIVKWSPEVVTETSAAQTSVGATLRDTLYVSGVKAGVRMNVVSTLYGPFQDAPAEQATVPADAPVVGMVTTVVDDNGTFVTDALTVPEGGYYVWHETIAATEATELWSGRFGVASETSYAPWQPRVTTETSHQVASPGQAITDRLTVTGARDGVELDVVSTLYGPFLTRPDEGSAVPADAPIAGTVTTKVSKNGTYETAPVTITAHGFYVWHETIDATPYSEAWDGVFGLVDETTLIPWHPKVSTLTSDKVAQPGAQITDAILVWDTHPTVELEVVSTLYGPFDARPVEVATVPDGAPVVGTVTTKVKGNGEYVTEPLTVGAAGFYVWRETIAATDSTEAWAGAFGVADETTLIPWEPKIVTETARKAEVGEMLTDHLTVSGAQSGVERVVKSTLYGPFEDRPGETGAVPKGAPIAGVVETVIKGDGKYTTPGIKLKATGFYTWVDTIDETVENGAWTSRFGIPSETSKVIPSGGGGGDEDPDSGGDGGERLPRTGAEIAIMLGLGLVLIVSGTGFVLIRRRGRLAE
ncbi:LPXTG cell wall anchor domain-containing protein [Sanguibacter hominis ATCC BAA-789]|uniref:LPXTG cell wall anchor domain-containing protein n=1 Tax=Sanguibacter hominis ATCC BAA-789 TaxID=1312740 RepID=A0A9X5ITE8_9MICO|nr:LPXTG cell wall anchor domain-containing protein [Sanguibacter hominis]NKX94266.1 LPXTG cell wall anchor domain-containing protein [Sanguibacter hominis ATCC BAA-789]